MPSGETPEAPAGGTPDATWDPLWFFLDVYAVFLS